MVDALCGQETHDMEESLRAALANMEVELSSC